MELLEIVLRNWPHLLEPFRVDGTPCQTYDSMDVDKSRHSRINLILTLSDGHGYFGRGMGITTAGSSSDASLEAIRMNHSLKRLGKHIEQYLSGTEGDYKIRLHREPDAIYAIDPNQDVCFKVFAYLTLKEKFLPSK